MGDINLAGYITGYGIIHRDGTVTEKHFDKPIHNKIVKTGINQLLRYNGNNSGGKVFAETMNSNYWENQRAFYPLFRGKIDTHYGCLHFCQLGTNNEPTNFFDTDLKQPFGDKVTTVKGKSTIPYTYTNVDTPYQYTIWITHTFSAFSETKEIGEIGYFGRYQPDPNDNTTIVYPLFSRISLSEKITVNEGEEFYCTYKLVITVDDTAKPIDNFMNIPGQKALMKYCPYCPTTGTISTICGYEDVYTNWNFVKKQVPFPCIDYVGNQYYPHPGGCASDDRLHKYRAFLFPQVYYRYKETYNNSNVNCLGNGQEFIQISTTNRNFRSPSEFNANGGYRYSIQSDYMNLLWYNENGTHQFVDYDPNTNYRDIKLIVPKFNPNLDTINKQSITFYNIYCRGYDYRLGYYDENMVWHPQPMTKWVNEQWEFTCRTTITTEDTNDWMNGTLT